MAVKKEGVHVERENFVIQCEMVSQKVTDVISSYVQAITLSDIKEAGFWRTMYKTFNAFCLERFGFKPAKVSVLTRVASRFLQTVGGFNLSISQLQECISLSDDDFVNLCMRNILTPKMTTSEIRQAVKRHKAVIEVENNQSNKEPDIFVQILIGALNDVRTMNEVRSSRKTDKKIVEFSDFIRKTFKIN